MNKRQVIVLWIIAIALGAAVAAVKLGQSHNSGTTTQRKPGQTLLASFAAGDVADIEIAGAAGKKVSLVKKDGKWVVTSRDNYPANLNFVNSLLRSVGELKVTRGLEAGPSFASHFGMDEAATTPDDHGLDLTFKDPSGKEIARVTLGKTIKGSAEPDPMQMGSNGVGRYVRNHADPSGFYAVSELFPSVGADPSRWLATEFISPENVRSISVTAPGATTPDWMLTRESAEAEFKLEGAQPEEILNTTLVNPLKDIFSYARFEDMIPAAEVAAKTIPDRKHTAVIQTFDGFTYTIAISPAKPSEKPADPADPEAMPPASDNYLMTLEVTATIPTERTKAADEKPEDAKTKDDAFAARRKALEEKLSKEKALNGITFEVSKSLVETLLKARKGILTEADPAAAKGGPVQSLPGGLITPPPPGIARPPESAVTPPIEVTTPPIEVPSVPNETPAPEENPQEAPEKAGN